MNVSDTITHVRGFRVSGIDAGLRAFFGRPSSPDLTLIAADGPCTAAGVFTTNLVKAAPVLLDAARLHTHSTDIRAVLINTASANACTGDLGLHNAEQTAAWTADALGCTPEQVLVMSTGVIGVHLPMDQFKTGIPKAVSALRADAWDETARAIMTTDTRPKQASVSCGGYTIAGIAKGAGMIAPNMATMLSVITTDAAVPAPLLKRALVQAADQSFNRVVVDGDMSTNDSLVLLASGASGFAIDDARFGGFVEALTAVCSALAQAIVRDGEGASRFITLQIMGAPSVADARQIGNTVATSPLVKTAFYGGDANWGRILAAAGRAGVPLQQDKLSLWFDELQLVANGMPLSYDEAQANVLAGQPEVTVTLDLGLGKECATIWTCDLSHDYVDINGHYRT